MESTKRYILMGLGLDVHADFGEMSKFFRENERRIKFIKSIPLFFGHEDDQMKHCDFLSNDLKLWLLQCDDEYYVFLNCGIKRYNNYEAVLDAHDAVFYDFSYPVLRNFKTEKEALEFYDRISFLLKDTVIHESITKMFNAKYFTEAKENDVNYGKILQTFEHTIYKFNNSQKFAIVLQKHNSQFPGNYSIIVNRNVRISFGTEGERNACWDFLVEFYEKFEEKKVDEISNQLFLSDFLTELMQNSDEVYGFQKREGQATFLECRFKNYHIRFLLITRNGRYHGKDFTFRGYFSPRDSFDIGGIEDRFKIEYLKSYLKKRFPDEEFLQKYINC